MKNLDMLTPTKVYWKNVISLVEKKEFLSIRIQYIKQSLNDKTGEMLTEAVDYLKKTKNWSFSICCSCEKRFFDNKLCRAGMHRCGKTPATPVSDMVACEGTLLSARRCRVQLFVCACVCFTIRAM